MNTNKQSNVDVKRFIHDFIQFMTDMMDRDALLMDCGIDMTEYSDKYINMLWNLFKLSFNEDQYDLVSTFIYEWYGKDMCWEDMVQERDETGKFVPLFHDFDGFVDYVVELGDHTDTYSNSNPTCCGMNTEPKRDKCCQPNINDITKNDETLNRHVDNIIDFFQMFLENKHKR